MSLTGEEQIHLQGCGPQISARRRTFAPFVLHLSFSKLRITLQVAQEGYMVPQHFPNTTRPSNQGPHIHIQYLQHDSDPSEATRDYHDMSNNCSTLAAATPEQSLQLLDQSGIQKAEATLNGLYHSLWKAHCSLGSEVPVALRARGMMKGMRTGST